METRSKTARSRSETAGRRNQCSDHAFHMSDLPLHTVMEILCRLPLKTLMAVKCVSKSWLNLISEDPLFAQLHRQSSPTEVLLRSDFCNRGSIALYLGNLQFRRNSVSNFKLSDLYEIPKSALSPKRRHRYFVNSCCGLLCFCVADSFDSLSYALVCNPVTDEYITVGRTESDEKMAQIRAYGLGFSGKGNRYKLLRVMRKNEYDSRQLAEILTFEKGSSSWRNLGDCPYKICGLSFCSTDFVFLKGRLHFHCRKLSSKPKIDDVVIGYFDFDKEQFGEVPLPPPQCDYILNGDETYKITRIGMLGSCLSLTRYGSYDHIEIWVLKKYGVKESWTKAFSVPKDSPPGTWFPQQIPLKCLETGEILMFRRNNHLVSYNPTLNRTITLGTSDSYLEIIAYSPTLLQLEDALVGYEARIYRRPAVDRDTGEDATPNWWRPGYMF